MRKFLLAVCMLTIGMFANADITQNQRLYDSMNTVKAFAFDNNRSVSADLIKRAKAVAIITNVTKVGAIASFSSARGTLSIKDEYGNWSNPFVIKYRSFGAGPQVGIASSDIIIFFNTSESFSGIFEGKDFVGVNAVGSIGNQGGGTAGAVTDLPELTAWAITPGSVTGLYIGASLDFGRIVIDDQATNDLYGRIYAYEDIVNGSPRDTKHLKAFKNTLTKFLGDEQYYRDAPWNPDEYVVSGRDYKKD
ncbi:MAG: lipid-binding SYLF domain-containing protein [Campylobacter sp.]|nr:lipid-binding SYLF domain-containing protein [Campylobacter sp.]